MYNQTIHELDINLLQKNPFQYRIEFDKDGLDELSNDILSNGLNSPITVLKDIHTSLYYIIAGERRTLACKLAKIPLIKCYIIEGSIDDPNIQKIMTVKMYNENSLHKNPSPIEEGVSYRKDLRPTIKNNYSPLYTSVSQLAGFILNLDKVRNLTDEQNKLRLNKIKDISRKILEKASTTDYIEDKIYNGELDDNFLMIKISEICQEISAPKVTARTLLDKKNKKTPFVVLSKSEFDSLDEQEKTKYQKQFKINKKVLLVNEFYDEVNKFYKENIGDNEDLKSILYKNFVETKFKDLQEELNKMNLELKDEKTEVMSYGKITKNKNKIKIDIDFEKIPQQKKDEINKYLDAINKIIS